MEKFPPTSFGDWLKERRKYLDLTREALAALANCSADTIKKIESGERRPSREVAAAIGRSLQLTAEEQDVFIRAARGDVPFTRLPKERSAPQTAPQPARRLDALPTPTTPFIGREPELYQLAELLENPECRLITFLGPGGIGKTRLSLAAAAAHRAQYQDGVAFISFGAVTEAVHALSTIADGLGFGFSGQSDPKQQLFNYLQGRSMLLVLDNAEQLVEEIGFLAELLEYAPNIRLLVTSRERLNLRGEWVFTLDGLPLPEEQQDKAVLENSAVRLFVQSANRLRPGFSPSPEDLHSICRICELVGGMPLGLELAATWIQVLSCAEIVFELEKGLDLLTLSQRDMPARHQSVRAVFDHSWNLLTPLEQKLFACLSIFKGGFTREAARQVADASLPLLAALTDKSLIRPSEAGRYTVHELLRQYAAERLEADADLHRSTQDRHSAYFLEHLVKQRDALCSSQQKDVLAWITADFNNILTAWEWAVKTHRFTELRAASWTFWYYFELRGTYQEGDGIFHRAEKALTQAMSAQSAPSDEIKILTANLKAHRGFLNFRTGQNTQSLEATHQAVSTLRQFTDEAALRDALWSFGGAAWVVGQFQAAHDVLKDGLEISKRLQWPWGVAVDTMFLGIVLHELGDYEKAFGLLEEAREQSQTMGDPRLIIFSTSYLSRTAYTLGRAEQMMKLLQSALQQAMEMNDRYATGLAWEQLGLTALQLGNTRHAIVGLEESMQLFRETNDHWSMTRVLNSLGDIALSLTELDKAASHYTEALTVALKVGTWPTAFAALLGLAKLAMQQNDPARAWMLAALVAKHPASETFSEQAKELQISLQSQLGAEQLSNLQMQIDNTPLNALLQSAVKNR